MKRLFCSNRRSLPFLASFLVIQLTALAQANFIGQGDVWKYQSLGEAPGADWNSLNYDDSAWPSGPAELGYGDGDEMTVTDPAQPPAIHRITTYFRRTFTVDRADIYPALLIQLVRDDGAVVYLNGTEILRDNMPAGEITPATLASTTVGAEDEKTFHQYSVPASALRNGSNVLAVEVHQVNSSSTDLSFNLSLQATTITFPTVKIVASTPTTAEPSTPGAVIAPGVFKITRVGSVDFPLTVYLRYDGTATPHADYQDLPAQVVIEAGSESTELKVFPTPDLLSEETETVIAKVSPPPTSPDSKPYLIDPQNPQATVSIRDANIPVVSLITEQGETMEPGPTTRIAPGRVLLRRTGETNNPLTVYLNISGTATPDADYPKINPTAVIPAGSSELPILVNAIDDPLFEGDETVLISFAAVPFPFPPPYIENTEHNSARVIIHDNDVNSTASIEITQPIEGAIFASGAVININATAIDPNGYIPAVQFYDGDNLIGRSIIDFFVAPPPGTPIEHTFTWQGAPAGQHTLTVRGVDSNGTLVISAPVHIVVTDSDVLPVVSIVATREITSEPSINALVAPGVFTLKRTGSTDRPLVVSVAYGGTATKVLDYKELPQLVEFPIGQAEVQLQVVAADDQLVEGDETVVAELNTGTDPAAGAPPYTVDPEHRVARVVIHDNDLPPTATIEITDPHEGASFPFGTSITINATAIDPKGYIGRVVFFDGDTQIGVSEIAFLVPPDPGTPIKHTFAWTGAAPGLHTLTAKGADSAGVTVVSPPVHISVTGGDLPIVSIVATQPETREQSPDVLDPATGAPLVPGIFTLRRTGSTDKSLVVYVSYGGTATRGTDYEELPAVVEFPVGKAEAQLFVVAKDDPLVEGDETVIAELIMPPTAGAALLYNIDPNQRVARVVIHDNDSAGSATIKITQPREGDLFTSGTTITITAVAVDPNGYIPRVEFWDGETKIGVSEIVFVRAPDPGTPITHTFQWASAAVGDHTLTARGKDTLGQAVVSDPVRIKVQNGTGTPVVRIFATDPEATELPLLVSAIDPATFTISRDGDSSRDTQVFYSIHGTAKNGADYKEIPTSITIPAGQSSATIQIVPITDVLTVVETMETVGIRLEPSPLVGPLPDYDIDPNAREAAGVIYEGRPPENGALELAIPSNGETFPAGADIDILAAGVHPPDGVRVVEFYADGQKIGVSEDWTKVLKTVYPHSFTWTNPPPGIHSLQAKSTFADGSVLSSSKIEVIVEGDTDVPIVSVRFLPDLTTRPWPNADFAPGSIEVRRTGPTNQPLRVFYGVSGTATAGADYTELPGYIDIPQGQAAAYIQVDAIDDQIVEGNETVVVTVVHPPQPVGDGPSFPDYQIDPEHRSATITILDNEFDDTRVVLSIEAVDPSATEPSASGIVDNAVFIIKRTAGPDVAVTAILQISGAAGNGVDYQEIKTEIDIPAEASSVEVVIKPIQDNLAEAGETVELHLVPPPCIAVIPPPPGCYLVGPNEIARAVIHDASGGDNHPPKVAITRPADGSVFLVGNPIAIRAEASDSDGTIERLDILADGQLLSSTKLSVLEFTWNGVPEGRHTLVARALDNSGLEGRSTEVRILVRQPDLVAFVRRELPGAYTPGVAFTVELRAEPPQGTHAYAVEDRPPTGWTVSEISHEGIFDPATGKVKFGPFFDADGRALTYHLKPPADTVGRKEFGGSSSINGVIYPIVGDRIIESVNSNHPADTTHDNSINLAELTAYAAAWKQGTSWPSGPVPIPMSFVTRAAMIWRHGEAYVFDPNQGAPPLCWVPANQNGSGLSALDGTTTERDASGDCKPGSGVNVQITITPATGVSSYAVEERVPAGWAVSNISDEGRFDATASVIRWGVFLDNNPRALKYTLTPPPDVASIGRLGGFVSFDGVTHEISGSDPMIATDATTTVHLDRCERASDGTIQLQLSGPAGQVGTLESSTDLVTWTEVKTLFLPDGVMSFTDDSGGGANKYYRLRIR